MTVDLGADNDIMKVSKFVGKVDLNGGDGKDTLQITSNDANVVLKDTIVTLGKRSGTVKNFEN